MPENTLQIDSYGRIVNISSEDLIKGMTAPVNKVSGGPLGERAGQSDDARRKLSEAVGPLKDTFLDPKEVKEIHDYLDTIVKFTEEVTRQREEYRKKKSQSDQGPNFKDLVGGLEQSLNKHLQGSDGIWDKQRAKAIDTFLYEAVHGQSIHVHDFILSKILVQVSKDIKHIGLLISQWIPEGNPPKKLGSFKDFDFPSPVPPPELFLRYGKRGQKKRKPGESPMPNPPGSVASPTPKSTGIPNGMPVDSGNAVGGGIDVNSGGVAFNSGGFEVSGAAAHKKGFLNKMLRGVGRPLNQPWGWTEGAMTLGPKGEWVNPVASPAKPVPGTAPLAPTVPLSPTAPKGEQPANSSAAQWFLHKSLVGQRMGMSKKLRSTPEKLEKLSEQLRMSLAPDQLDKVALGLREFHEFKKGDQQILKDLIKVLQKYEMDAPEFKEASNKLVNTFDRLQTRLERTNRWEAWKSRGEDIKNTFKPLTDQLLKLTPANLGITPGVEFMPSPKPGAEWMKNIHAAMYETAGMTGGALGKPEEDIQRKYYDMAIGPKMGALHLQTGTNEDVIRKQFLKNIHRGVTEYTKLNQLTKQGLALGRLIGSDAEQTADELADWSMHMGMTTDQTAQLANNVQKVGRLTGVAGDNLLQAVKSSRVFAENMRDAGTFTDDASKKLIQFSAAAKKYGTEKELGPIMESLTDTNSLFKNTGMFALLARAVGPQHLGALQQGQLMNTPGGMDQLSEGLKELATSFTHGADPEELMRRANAGDAAARQQLMGANLAISTLTEGQVKGLGALLRIQKTFEEGSLTTEKKLEQVNAQLAGGVMSTRDEMLLKATKQQLELQQAADQVSTGRTGEIRQKITAKSGAVDLKTAVEQTEGAGRERGIAGALADYQKQLSMIRENVLKTEVAPKEGESRDDYLLRRKTSEDRKSSTAVSLQKAIDTLEAGKGTAGTMTGKQYLDLLQNVDDTVGPIPQIAEKLQALDVLTSADSKERAWNHEWQGRIENAVNMVAHGVGPEGVFNIDFYTKGLPLLTSIATGIVSFLTSAGTLLLQMQTLAAVRGLSGAAGATGATGAAGAGRGFLGTLGMGALRLGGGAAAGYLTYEDYQQGGLRQAATGLSDEKYAGYGPRGEGNVFKDVGSQVGKYAGAGLAIGGPMGGAIGAIVGEFVLIADVAHEGWIQWGKYNDAVKEGKDIVTRFSASMKDATIKKQQDVQTMAREGDVGGLENELRHATRQIQAYNTGGDLANSPGAADLLQKNLKIKGDIDALLPAARETEKRKFANMSDVQKEAFKAEKYVKTFPIDNGLNVRAGILEKAGTAMPEETDYERLVRASLAIPKQQLKSLGLNAEDIRNSSAWQVYRDIDGTLFDAMDKGPEQKQAAWQKALKVAQAHPEADARMLTAIFENYRPSFEETGGKFVMPAPPEPATTPAPPVAPPATTTPAPPVPPATTTTVPAPPAMTSAPSGSTSEGVRWDVVLPTMLGVAAALAQAGEVVAATSATDKTSQARSSAAGGMGDTAKNRYMQQIASVEITGPINEAVDHLDQIEVNTRDTAEETKLVKEEIKRLIAMLTTSGSPTLPAGDTSTRQRASSPANYWSFALPLSNPNVGAVRHTGVT